MAEQGSFDLKAFVDGQSAAIGLDLTPERHAAVSEVAIVLHQMASLVMDFPLDGDLIAAPVFKP